MSFAFRSRVDVGQQVREMVAHQVEKAIAKANKGEDLAATAHSLRRRCKKIRGVLRLVQPNFKAYGDENAAVRTASDLLGGVRDAQVMIETLDHLNIAEHSRSSRSYLVARAEHVAGTAHHSNPLRQFSDLFQDLRSRVEGWAFKADGFDLVGDGLEKSYRQFRRDLRNAGDGSDATALHEWRKHAKYHGFHVALLDRTASRLLGSRADALAELGTLLGDHHNLHVLATTLGEANDDLASELTVISDVIRDRQDALARDAFALGRQLAAEKPGALRRRFHAYWRLLPDET